MPNRIMLEEDALFLYFFLSKLPQLPKAQFCVCVEIKFLFYVPISLVKTNHFLPDKIWQRDSMKIKERAPDLATNQLE